MSLTSKLSVITLLSSSLFAANNADIETFLKRQIGANPSVKSLEVKVVDTKKLDAPKGWEAVIVNLNAKVMQGANERPVSQRMVYFVNGDYLTGDLTNIKTGEQLKNSVGPEFKAEFYNKANLIYGNENAKHKVAIFSDPLCPFCRRFVPEAVNYMKQYPETFAVYYYHFPLEQLHPAAVALTKAAVAAELKGRKDTVLDMYKVEVDSKLTDEKAILEAFNKTLGTSIAAEEIHAEAVKKHTAFDMNVVSSMMVSGTPTMFFDGKKDDSKAKYKEVKVK
ncbi:MAG: thioredoxin domain-containing protein [Campylobacterales bacterium]|nr:thioredoxin domain-containing protein [Campylobacterales bacterium]